jgi:hypothetical protein
VIGDLGEIVFGTTIEAGLVKPAQQSPRLHQKVVL